MTSSMSHDAGGRDAAPNALRPLDRLVAEGVAIQYVSTKDRRPVLAVEDISIAVRDRSFVSVVGPSGCGKSSFLSVIAGLRPATRGHVRIDGQEVRGPGPGRALVFQHPALLPWRSVLDNVAYGLELSGSSKSSARERARQMVETVGLSGSERRYPHELSGGMRQRVNLARALVTDPNVLLLDEPFAALDEQTRELLQDELLRIWSAHRTLAMFVTHQISEAIYLSDSVVVLSGAPSRVRAAITIDLPRPRTREMRWTPEFVDYEHQIFELIRPDIHVS